MAYVGPVSKAALSTPDDLRRVLIAATQQLLGGTITLSDDAWFEPTALPGWLRSHVATHLNLQARAITAALRAIATGRTPTWPGADTPTALKAGARRDAIALQEELDRSAADLMRVIDAIPPESWQAEYHSGSAVITVWRLLVCRLNEVVLHHVDLAIGFNLADLDPRVATTLLSWNLPRVEPRFTQVRLELTADEGWTESIGWGQPVPISGSIAALLGWITGRVDSTAVLGADRLGSLPRV